MATNEELEARVKELESLIIAEYDPPSGPEYSFPVPGQPIDQDQFQLLSLPSGDGVIDRGDIPYGLRGMGSTEETNAANTMYLTVGTHGKAEAIVAGYYHVMNTDKLIHLDPVSTETIYRVCLTYDPRIIDETGAPGDSVVSVQVYTTPPPTSFGRVHVVMHKVTRKPNQLLTDATIERVRPRIAPSLVFGSHDQLPKPSSVIWGSLAHIHGIRKDILVAKGDGDEGVTRWESIISPPWNDLDLSAGYEALDAENKPQWRIVGDMIEYHGQVKRKNGANLTSGEYVKFGRISGPAYMRATYVSAIGTGARSAFVSGTNDGRDISYYLRESGATWLSIDCRIPVRFEP